MDLFTGVVAEDKFHQNFARTLEAGASGVRTVLNGWAECFADRDGKFVIEFQTTYNSSFWELYLFAVLRHLGIEIDLTKAAPDFVAAKRLLAVEAVIASHALGDVPEWQKTFEDLMKLEARVAQDQTVIRCSNALHNKSVAYRATYSRLPHMKERPYVIAISNFGTPNFYLMGDTAMQRLLYDPTNEKFIRKANGSPVALGVFRTEALSHVSGVLYSSVASFGKARALSPEAEDCTFAGARVRNGTENLPFTTKKADYTEALTDGLRFFSNPYASNPVDARLFQDPGIKRFLADKKGNVAITCNPAGDLDWRMVVITTEKPVKATSTLVKPNEDKKHSPDA